MRPVQAITLRLEQQGVGVRGTTIFHGTGVDVPNTGTIVTVTETGGQGPQNTHNGTSLKQPSFQIVARATDYLVAAAKADQAYHALRQAANRNILIGDVFFLWIKPLQEPFTLPLDGNGRNRVAFNIETVRRG